MGTVIAPEPLMAKSAVRHSGRFAEKKADAIPRLYAELHKRRRQAGNAAHHLRACVRQVVHSVQEARGKGALAHGLVGGLRFTVAHGCERCNKR